MAAPKLENRLKKAEWLRWPQTHAVLAALSADGHTVRAVGGAVRNSLLGRPVEDVDLVTDALPETVIGLARKGGLKAVPTGIEHGTVTVVANHRPFEVTTLRTDVETYGRHAKVAFTDDWEADARRRDFTINALYADANGAIYDPLGGLADIAAHRVRFIGAPEARIREDYLRILRFFRFVAELEAPEIDGEGLAACVRERAGLDRLAAERVRGELARLLIAPAALKALTAMADFGLLTGLLGAVGTLARFERLTVVERAVGTPADFTLRLAALAVAVTEDAERLADRFRLSSAERASLMAAARFRGFDAGLSEQDAKTALYHAGGQAYRSAVLMAWAASGAGADAARWRALYALPDRWPVPAFPLKGADIRALGVPEGPDIGAVLARLEARWIAGGFSGSREALCAEAKRYVEDSAFN